MMNSHDLRRKFLIKELVQTSSTDCGPACLASLLDGFGIRASYPRLREACQTDLEGTSIESLEEAAIGLGLSVEQTMMPSDHLLLPEASAVPSLLVVCLPQGYAHFVILWRDHGPIVQIMDPRVGRRWTSRKRLLEEAFVHTITVPAEQWKTWASSAQFVGPLGRRLRELCRGNECERLLESAVNASGWRQLGALDASVRLVTSLVVGGGMRRGRQARVLVERLMEGEMRPWRGEFHVVPKEYWSVRPIASAHGDVDQLKMFGAVLLRVRGRMGTETGKTKSIPALGPELAAAVTESPNRPARELLRLVRGARPSAWGALGVGLGLTTLSFFAEAVVLRALIGMTNLSFTLAEQRYGIAFVIAFVISLTVLEVRTFHGLAWLGRRLETQLRMRFLEKLPRLKDRYFSSRSASDMADRCHTLHHLRTLPRVVGQFLQAELRVVLSVVALCMLEPDIAIGALAAGVLCVGLPLAMSPTLFELNVRVRTHLGAMYRFHLDALLGLKPLRAHSSERRVRREHEGLLVEWARASWRYLFGTLAVEGVVAIVGFWLAAWLVFEHLPEKIGAGDMLLMSYWALNIPVFAIQGVGSIVQIPEIRSVTVRALEPLGAPEDLNVPSQLLQREERVSVGRRGVELEVRAATIETCGRQILKAVSAQIKAGSRVAIIGPSGAGKSTFVGLFLGWHRLSGGEVLIDGRPLDSDRLERLRAETSWVDPAVRIWNRSLIENLMYGGEKIDEVTLDEICNATDLHEVLRRLPAGLQAELGEGGRCVSGGQGQRIRLGRGMAKRTARLVILDEPFRGLDRDSRHRLLSEALRWWREATILYITHDIEFARGFSRVLIFDQGCLAEDGDPRELGDRPGTRFRSLLEAERAQTRFWSSVTSRQLWLESGKLRDIVRGVGR